MRYRRADAKGGSYFFTINLAERQRTLLTDEIDLLRSVMNKVKQRHSFKIDAIVVLPDHLHTIWTLPEGDNNFSMRLGLIKSGFSRQIPKNEKRSISRCQKGERGVWQRRYWEHLIRDDRDFEQHVNYIHYNPVKHGYVARPVDWECSSIHKYIEKGIVPKDWGFQGGFVKDKVYGERV